MFGHQRGGEGRGQYCTIGKVYFRTQREATDVAMYNREGLFQVRLIVKGQMKITGN